MHGLDSGDMFNLELRNKIREAISDFRENLADTSELQLQGWIEIAHSANYMEGAYYLNELLEEKRNE